MGRIVSSPHRAIIRARTDLATIAQAMDRSITTPVRLTEVRWSQLRGLAGDDWRAATRDPAEWAQANALDWTPTFAREYRSVVGPEMLTLGHPSGGPATIVSLAFTEFGDGSHPPAVLGYSLAKQFAKRAITLLPEQSDASYDAERIRY